MNKGIDVLAGVVDADYRGQVKVVLINHDTTNPFVVVPGDRIAQLILERYIDDAQLVQVAELDETLRADGCFGSTGVSQPPNSLSELAEDCMQKADSETDPAVAVLYRIEATNLFLNMKRTAVASRNLKKIAEYYEGIKDYDNAIQYYQRAADIYEQQNSCSSAHACLLKNASFEVIRRNWSRAMELYENVAKKCLCTSMGKYTAQKYYFRASLCAFVLFDYESAKIIFNQYADADETFAESMQRRLLDQIYEAFSNGCPQEFTCALSEYNQTNEIDEDMNTLLLAVKAKFQ